MTKTFKLTGNGAMQYFSCCAAHSFLRKKVNEACAGTHPRPFGCEKLSGNAAVGHGCGSSRGSGNIFESVGKGVSIRQFTPIGTYRPVPIDQIFENLVIDGVFIDRRNNTPMEMDAYSAYLALKACDDGGDANRAARQRIVEVIEARRQACGGLWRHGVWAPAVEEIHLRFTAAALRLLVEAHVDGLYPDVLALVATLKAHLSHVEQLDIGPWFLHDSLECPAFAEYALEKPLPNQLWGSTSGNCLVLNTHIDTLLTLYDALARVALSAEDREDLTNLAQAATTTLERSLAASPPWWWGGFGMIDSLARGFLLNNPQPKSRIANIVKWRIVINGWFRLRRRVKACAGIFVFGDGYLERDISLLGYFMDYHVYNLHDLVRLVRCTDRSAPLVPALRKRILAIVGDAIDYACRAPYADFVIAGTRENGRAAVLVEAIEAWRTLSPGGSVPAAWTAMAERIAHIVPPTPALMGYDPFVLPAAEETV